jgi:hypothetical protein
MTESTCPISDLKYFDSLASVAFTVHVFIGLGWKDPPPFTTLFLGKSGETLTVGEVADRIMALIEKKE